MVASGTLLDTGMVYFDARLSEHYPTLEIRIADVCLYAGDAVLIAALSRALVETEARRWRAGAGVQHQRIEILRLAGWRASRSGLDDVLLNPLTGRPEPAATVARTLLDHVRDALDEAGEAAAVSDLLTAVLARGNGAAFQRSACRDGGMADMIDSAATATTRLTIGGRYPHGGRYRALRRHGPVRRCGRRSGRSRAGPSRSRPGQPGAASRRVDRPCCGLTWLRWIMPGPGAHHSNIGGGEVITDAQYGVPGSLGERVCEAVTEIQPGGMTPLAISSPAAYRPGGQVCVNRHDVDLRVTEESVDDVLPSRPEPGLDDDAQLDADGGRHQPGEGVL